MLCLHRSLLTAMTHLTIEILLRLSLLCLHISPLTTMTCLTIGILLRLSLLCLHISLLTAMTQDNISRSGHLVQTKGDKTDVRISSPLDHISQSPPLSLLSAVFVCWFLLPAALLNCYIVQFPLQYNIYLLFPPLNVGNFHGNPIYSYSFLH